MNKKKTLNSQNYSIGVDTMRVLACEMVSLANSGHAGIALSAAPTIFALFKNHLVANPKQEFINRDRFVLSAGHGSALLYATMHLAGYDVSIKDLMNFRKINSKTAGHPENTLIEGVDATTGPLGQGLGIALGMAIAETRLNAYFKKYNLINYYTYCLFGDGDLQEGISYEVFSLAAKLKLNKLIYLFDSNGVQLESSTNQTIKIDYKKYFESLGLNYIKVSDGNNVDAISAAIETAKKSEDKPTVIEIKSIIGYRTQYEGTYKAHGALNKEEVAELKSNLDYSNEPFEVAKNAYLEFEAFNKRGTKRYEDYLAKVAKLKEKEPKKFEVLNSIIEKEFLVDDKQILLNTLPKIATRDLANDVLNQIAVQNPLLLTISPDLSASTKITINKAKEYDEFNRLGPNLLIGVKEFTMGAIINGLSLVGIKAIGSTFLTFSDYVKPAIRLAALSKSPGIFVFSHDSIAVGEDGPTHQPIEQLWSLRLIPNVVLFRPANFVEMLDAFKFAFETKDKVVIIVTGRQSITNEKRPAKTKKGAYVYQKTKGSLVSLIATGSEVEIATETATVLDEKYGLKADVISMPSFELFKQQVQAYKNTLWENKKILVSIEFGSTLPWKNFVHLAFGINHFGASGSHVDLMKKFKLQPSDIAAKINEYYLANKKKFAR